MTVRTYSDHTLVLSQIMPLWPFFLFLTVGIAFMVVTFVFQIYREIQAMGGKKVLHEELDSVH